MPERPRRGSVDVFLLPAVIGRGRGDIAEVELAGRYLASGGYRIVHPPTPVAGSDEPAIPIDPAAHAVTVSPQWGVSAGPGSPGPLGRPGMWYPRVREIESSYGSERVLHISLEEFARTLTSREQCIERLREGGVPLRTIRRRLASRAGRAEVSRFHREYRRFRAFGAPNVLHLFPTFQPRPAFAREFPEAVQIGPISPWHGDHRRSGRGASSSSWLWYASPGSSPRLLPVLLRALALHDPDVRLVIRGSSVGAPVPGDRWGILSPLDERRWRTTFRDADLRIVTGSRSLIEAVARRAPFLYFNGVVGIGRSRRAHRPDKLRALLRMGRAAGISFAVRRDLADFARIRSVRGVVGRALGDPGWRREFSRWPPFRGFAPHDAPGERVLLSVARTFAVGSEDASALVERLRRPR